MQAKMESKIKKRQGCEASVSSDLFTACPICGKKLGKSQDKDKADRMCRNYHRHVDYQQRIIEPAQRLLVALKKQ